MSLRIGQVKNWQSPIVKFHSNSESPTQTEYARKFSDQSDCWKYFYWTRKVDDAFFWEKIIILEFFFYLCQIKSVWPQNWTECIKMISLQDCYWFEVEWRCNGVSIAENRFLVLNFGYFFRPCPICPIFRGHLKSKLLHLFLYYKK